ncbi:winged helix-turn-helix transcriptional regulator [Fodinibius saliphilus]|uniref:winged helix-turn-helix transcriptional regulator n=1 Tax=Fodinibius saliphilus TaxID=1920650 RepID=UPI001108AD3C|nr:winged helix-turn-helix transcriptional regulator [Fodinibius saliphilus]
MFKFKEMQKRNRNKAEKKVLKMMIDADVSQKMIAEHLDITPQAVNNRLKRGSVEPLIKAIEELEEQNA